MDIREKVNEYYLVVKEIMNINTLTDIEARRLLASKMGCYLRLVNGRKIFKKIFGKNVFIFGAAPSLEEDILNLKGILISNREKISIISVNGATKALISHNIFPDIVVTDLDGDFDSIFKAATEGALIVVHGHGDNILALSKYLSKIGPYSICTTQLENEECIVNFGGFTDGDRALYLAKELGASKIFLIAMDFGEIVGKYSKPWLKKHVYAWSDKRKKFKIAKKLIGKYLREFQGKLYTLGKSRIVELKIRHLNYSEVENIIGK